MTSDVYNECVKALPSFLTSMIKTLKSKVEEQGRHYHKEDDDNDK